MRASIAAQGWLAEYSRLRARRKVPTKPATAITSHMNIMVLVLCKRMANPPPVTLVGPAS